MTPDEALARLTPFQRRVREAYFARCRELYADNPNFQDYGLDPIPQWDGGENTFGRRFRSCWPSIAKTLLEAGIYDVEEYMRFVVQSPSTTKPPQLKSDRHIQAFLRHQRGCASGLQDKYRTYLRKFASAVRTTKQWFPQKSNKDVWRHVLLSTAWHLPPLFCYITAEEGGLQDVMNIYRPLAIDELSANFAAYREEWSDVIPPELFQAAEAYLLRLGTENGENAGEYE